MESTSFIRFYNLIDIQANEVTCRACFTKWQPIDEATELHAHIETTDHLQNLIKVLDAKLATDSSVPTIMETRYLKVHKMVLYNEHSLYCQICAEKLTIVDPNVLDILTVTADKHIRTSPGHIQHMVNRVHEMYDEGVFTDTYCAYGRTRLTNYNRYCEKLADSTDQKSLNDVSPSLNWVKYGLISNGLPAPLEQMIPSSITPRIPAPSQLPPPLNPTRPRTFSPTISAPSQSVWHPRWAIGDNFIDSGTDRSMHITSVPGLMDYKPSAFELDEEFMGAGVDFDPIEVTDSNGANSEYFMLVDEAEDRARLDKAFYDLRAKQTDGKDKTPELPLKLINMEHEATAALGEPIDVSMWDKAFYNLASETKRGSDNNSINALPSAQSVEDEATNGFEKNGFFNKSLNDFYIHTANINFKVPSVRKEPIDSTDNHLEESKTTNSVDEHKKRLHVAASSDNYDNKWDNFNVENKSTDWMKDYNKTDFFSLWSDNSAPHFSGITRNQTLDKSYSSNGKDTLGVANANNIAIDVNKIKGNLKYNFPDIQTEILKTSTDRSISEEQQNYKKYSVDNLKSLQSDIYSQEKSFFVNHELEGKVTLIDHFWGMSSEKIHKMLKEYQIHVFNEFKLFCSHCNTFLYVNDIKKHVLSDDHGVNELKSAYPIAWSKKKEDEMKSTPCTESLEEFFSTIRPFQAAFASLDEDVDALSECVHEIAVDNYSPQCVALQRYVGGLRDKYAKWSNCCSESQTIRQKEKIVKPVQSVQPIRPHRVEAADYFDMELNQMITNNDSISVDLVAEGIRSIPGKGLICINCNAHLNSKEQCGFHITGKNHRRCTLRKMHDEETRNYPRDVVDGWNVELFRKHNIAIVLNDLYHCKNCDRTFETQDTCVEHIKTIAHLRQSIKPNPAYAQYLP